MKFSNQALMCLIATFQKALIEGVDISDILRNLEFVQELEAGLLHVMNPEITNLSLPTFDTLSKELDA